MPPVQCTGCERRCAARGRTSVTVTAAAAQSGSSKALVCWRWRGSRRVSRTPKTVHRPCSRRSRPAPAVCPRPCRCPHPARGPLPPLPPPVPARGRRAPPSPGCTAPSRTAWRHLPDLALCTLWPSLPPSSTSPHAVHPAQCRRPAQGTSASSHSTTPSGRSTRCVPACGGALGLPALKVAAIAAAGGPAVRKPDARV